MNYDKPLRFHMKIVAMLRGEVAYSEDIAPIAELAIYAYQDGLAGVPYEPVKEDPGFPAWTAQCLDQFLRAAHLQGRVDAGLDQHTPYTAPLCTADVNLEAVPL